MIRRVLLAAALGAGLYATAAPATACELRYCPGTSIVCGIVSCQRPILIGCEQPLGILHVCV